MFAQPNVYKVLCGKFRVHKQVVPPESTVDVEIVGPDLNADDPMILRSNDTQTTVDVEIVGPDLSADDPMIGDVPETTVETEELDCGGYAARSSSSQWRDQQNILEAANHDPDAVIGTARTVLKTGPAGMPGANLLKKVYDDPRLGEPLLKYAKKLEENLEKMESDLKGWDENGKKVTPIECLAYLLGFYYVMFIKATFTRWIMF